MCISFIFVSECKLCGLMFPIYANNHFRHVICASVNDSIIHIHSQIWAER